MAERATGGFTGALLDADRARPLGAAFGRILHLGARLLRHDRYDDYRFERCGDLRLVVLPTVSNPKLLRTGAFFASVLNQQAVAPVTALDLGTGSGICALAVAPRANRVVAVDINRAAVRCAQINASLNGLEHKVEVRPGDLFSSVPGERFDLVMFNPPFLSGAPRDDRDAAWRGAGLAGRFAAELADHLTPGGRALLLLSSWGAACRDHVDELVRRGFRLTAIARKHHVNETITIVEVVPP
ncbi:MAG TPA: methyltransferase [Steroidobacteraceae bacterium]